MIRRKKGRQSCALVGAPAAVRSVIMADHHSAHPSRVTAAPGLIGAGVAVAIAYVAAALVGFRFAFVAEQVTTVWAPAGIGLAALLLWGQSLWPAIWVGAFIANTAADTPLWAAGVVATGNTLEAVAANWLLRFTRFDTRLRRVRDGVALVGLGAVASSTLSATIGVAALSMASVGFQSTSRRTDACVSLGITQLFR